MGPTAETTRRPAAAVCSLCSDMVRWPVKRQITMIDAKPSMEGLASIIVIWRFTGQRTMSEHSEHTAAAGRRVVSAVGPIFVYEAIRRLIVGSDTTGTTLGSVVTAPDPCPS